MTMQKTLVSCVFVLAAMASAVAMAQQDEDVTAMKTSTWRIQLNLDTPSLVPPAVQWAIFDKNPVRGFKAEVTRMQGYHRTRLEQAENEVQKELHRSSSMTVNWNWGFKEVSGREVHLLTSAPGRSHSICSNGPDGKKWIVTKTVQIEGKPACWVIPVKVKTGEEIQVSLTEDNMFDLRAAFDKTMRKASRAE